MYKHIIALLLCVLIFSSFGCGKDGKEGKVVVVGIVQDLPTLDPAMHRDRTVESVLRNMFDCLTTRDPDMKIAPQLAESWEPVDDLTWKFNLKEKVKFHNNQDFAAKDVKFSIDRIIKPNSIAGRSSPRKGLIGPVSEVEVVDNKTVLIKTSQPWPILPAMLTFIEIVPADYILKNGDDHFAQNPVGTGPYKFANWVKGERLVLEKFDGYYGGSPDKPPVGVAKVDRVIFKPIPEPASRIASLKAGDSHIIQNLPPHLIKKVEDDSKTEVLTCNGTRSYFVGMNVNTAPFNDPLVRRAMNHAINVELIINSILKGMAIRIPGPLVPAAFGYNEDLEPYKYDPDLAKEILKKAGYSDGFSVELDTDEDSKEIAETVASDLSKIGVKAKVRVWDWGLLKPQLEKNERTMFMFSWGNASLDPVGILIPVFKTSERGNYMGYSNPEVDKLLKTAETGMQAEARISAFQQIQEILYEDAPTVFMYSPNEIYGIRKSVKGWGPTPDGRIDMHDVYLASN